MLPSPSAPGVASVRVKICGITNREDAETAIALGADALGFNLYAGSKRHLDLPQEAGWISALPPFVTKVAVMVNHTLQEARATFALPFVDLLQLHGEEDAAFCAALAHDGVPFFKAIRLRDSVASFDVAGWKTENVLLDAFAPGEYGGTGKLIDLPLAARFARNHPHLRLALSGGLTPENVAAAIEAVRPYAVDVASGVETKDNPRRKDPAKVAAFIRAARSAGSGEARVP